MLEDFVDGDLTGGACGADEGGFEEGAFGEAVFEAAFGLEEVVEEAGDAGGVDFAGLAFDDVELSVGEVAEEVAVGGVGLDEDVAEVFEEVEEDAFEVFAGFVEAGDGIEEGGDVPGEDGGGEVFEVALGDEAEDGEDIVLGEVAAAEGDELIEGGLGVAHAALGAAGDGDEGILGGVDGFGFADEAEAVGDVAGADAAEVEALTAGEDGGGDFLRFGGGEEEFDVCGGLFEGFEEGVEGTNGEHVDFVDDINFVAGVVGAEFGVFADFADGIDAVVAGPVDFEDVHGVAGGDFAAAFADVAGGGGGAFHAVEALGEDAGGGGFAGAAGADEEVGVGDAVLGDGAGEGIGDVSLADDVGEDLGPVFAGDNFVSHREGFRGRVGGARMAARGSTAPVSWS